MICCHYSAFSIILFLLFTNFRYSPLNFHLPRISYYLVKVHRCGCIFNRAMTLFGLNDTPQLFPSQVPQLSRSKCSASSIGIGISIRGREFHHVRTVLCSVPHIGPGMENIERHKIVFQTMSNQYFAHQNMQDQSTHFIQGHGIIGFNILFVHTRNMGAIVCDRNWNTYIRVKYHLCVPIDNGHTGQSRIGPMRPSPHHFTIEPKINVTSSHSHPTP
mmetsp:Transcript_14456/g.26230  ORF Transcript_14456/g.26230 Transcript_14456/m.26230 type:complete len:217 (+) Transcript_14456:621-1271(+)